MPENDFEKQVQDLFSGMKVKPSAEVWSNVQDRIKKDKDRRRFLFWIPAALVLFSAGGYWLLHSVSTGENKMTYVAPLNTVEEPVTPVGKNHAGSAGSIKEAATGATEQIIEGTINTATTEPSQNENTVGELTEIKRSEKQGDIEGRKANTAEITDRPEVNTLSDRHFSRRQVPNTASPSVIATEKNSFSSTGARTQPLSDNTRNTQAGDNDEVKENVNSEALLTGSLQKLTAREALSAPAVPASIHPTSINKTSSAIVKLAKKKGWEFGLSAGAGISGLGKGLASDIFADKALENNVQSAVAAPPAGDYNNYAGLLNGYLAAAQPPPASPIKPGFAWNVGGFAKWHVANRITLSGKIAYAHFTTRREVGKAITDSQQVNAPAQLGNARFAGLYANSSQSEASLYTNQYHYLQVPLGIEWQINKGIVLPLIVDAGLSIGYMINTNAVHYNVSSGLYAQDKKHFNRLQGGLYAGLQTKLLQHSAMPLYVGPFIQYNYTSLTKNSSDSKQNFMFAGLRAQWVLFKK